MRRVTLVSALVWCSCLGPNQNHSDGGHNTGFGGGPEIYSADGGPPASDPTYLAGSACGPSEAGDPQNYVHAGVYYQRPPCDVAAINRPSTAPMVPLHGIDAPTDELKGVAQLMVGQWRGTQTSPWDNPSEVQLTLFENGRYSGTTSDDALLFFSGESCAAHRDFWGLEYGTAELAFGLIQIAQEAGLGCGTQRMRRIQVDTTTLRFELWWGEYGPVVLDLQRVEVTP